MRKETEMTVRNELDELVKRLMLAGIPRAAIGLELIVLGAGMLTQLWGAKKMAEEFSQLAARFDQDAELIDLDECSTLKH